MISDHFCWWFFVGSDYVTGCIKDRIKIVRVFVAFVYVTDWNEDLMQKDEEELSEKSYKLKVKSQEVPLNNDMSRVTSCEYLC